MKLVVFSDIHGNSYALDAFLEKLKQISYDYLIFCGDIFGYYYNQKEIIHKLSKIERLIWLKGNHDAYFLELYHGNVNAQSYIEKYGHSYESVRERYDREEAGLVGRHESEYILKAGERTIGIFHGTPEDSLEGRLYPDKPVLAPKEYQKYDIVLLGHTHCRMVRWEGNTLVVNSGSLGQPRDGNGYGFAIVDTDSLQVEFQTVEIEQSLLYEQIDQYDPRLKKLKEVLERRKK